MSIRLQILLPMILLALAAVSVALFSGYSATRDQALTAGAMANAIRGGELSRRAHDDFDRLIELVAEVSAMTHFVSPEEVRARFDRSASGLAGDLQGLDDVALSVNTKAAALRARNAFALWRADAEAVLGLRAALAIAMPDEIKRKGDAAKALLDTALDLTGEDARAKLDAVGAGAKFGTHVMLIVAIVFGAGGLAVSFRVAGGVAGPVRELARGAAKLAAGDVSVAFAGSGRRDEIGEVARAVALFRDRVIASQHAEAEAAADRRAAESARRHSDELRAASGEEQGLVVEALATGLGRLAERDLTFRLSAHFGSAYARLKTDFNGSLDALQRALSAISEGALDMRSGSTEIARLADDLEQRAGAQTASIEEAAAALEEITATVRMTAEGAGEARAIVSKTREEAGRSGAVVRTAVDAIGRIQKSSEGIETIIAVIDEIAFQTNLLALNAGVEAARAGESGRGFAVVATEVRALAQRSAQASKEIQTLISASSAHVKEGVELVFSAGAALDRIFAQVSEIDRVVTAIASGAAEQSTGLQSVNKGVSDIDRMNQNNVTLVEQSRSASSALAEKAEGLVRSVARFAIDDRQPAVAQRAPARRVA